MSKSEARTPGGSATKATGADNVQVVCRVRPLNTKEISECAHRCIQTVHDSIKLGDKIFTYNQVFAENSTQTDVFNSIGLPVIDGVFQGFNGTIFAYGQTGSGKTHTMMGPDFENNSTAELWGIIPRAVESIFSRISNAEDMECSVHVSFFEIYNEKVNDLLNSNNKGIDMRQANTEWEEVLTHKTVNGYQKAMKILEQGVANRKTASTDMNSTSSRSHSIFVISLKQTDVMTKRSLVGKLYLVDLAGSEKQKKTNTTGERFKEGTNINKSLFVLSRVISALTENQFVPYRDSVLTKVLKHSLGGNCKTALVINVSPASTNESETKSTLEFGSNAKKIKNDPRVNTLDDNKEMAELRGIIETQRLRIADLTKQLELIGGTDISLNASFTSISDFEGTGMNDSFSLTSVSSGVCHSCKVALEEEEKQLSSRGEELLAEVKSLRAKVKKGENTVLVYQKRLKDLEKMDAESKRIKDQQETHASWVKKQLDLTDEIKKLESEIPKITRQHTKTKSQHNELKDRLEKEEDQVEQLQNQIADLIDRSEQMKQEKEALMAELTISTTHAEVAIKEKQELQNQTKAMLATISSENDRLAEQLASLESELTKYNEKYQKTSELVNNQKMINDNMEKTLDELVSQRSKLSDRTTIIQRDLNTVTKDLKELEANKKNLIASREVERNNIGNVKQELADMKSLVQSVTNQVMDLKSQETKCVNELGMLEAKLISLTENKQRMGKEKEGLVKSIEDLTSELAEQSAKKKLLEQQSADLGRMEEELLAHNSHTKDRLESLKQLSAEYLRSLESTEIELNSRRSTIENLKQEMENHSEQKKFLECQYGILKIQSDSLQQKVSEAKSLKAQLEDDSNSMSREISTLAEKCNLLELEKNELHHKGTELRSQLNQIHQENVSYHTEIEDVCRVLTESKVTLSVNKEVLAATKQELHIVKEELESKKAQLSNLHGHVASHSEQLQHMQHRNDTLRNNLEQLEEEHKNLANRLRVERETMAKEKQLHLQHMIDEENKRRETEKKYREEMLLASVQERKMQDESLDYEIQGYNTRLEKVVKEMQQEMSTKMQLLSVQSQEFEKRILAITRRKRELTMELQAQPHTSVDTIASPISKRRSVRVD